MGWLPLPPSCPGLSVITAPRRPWPGGGGGDVGGAALRVVVLGATFGERVVDGATVVGAVLVVAARDVVARTVEWIVPDARFLDVRAAGRPLDEHAATSSTMPNVGPAT